MAPMDLLSSFDAELTTRSIWMPNVESLDFVNDPITSGPYQNPGHLTQPNTGLYALRLVSKNQVYLEYENRLCDILYMLERMEPSDAKEDMEDRILQELARINTLKEVEWSGQRSMRCVKGAVVNTGASICLHSHCIVVTDYTPEKYFVTRHPKNETLTAIYVTALAMYVIYRVPRRGAAVLLAGMKSILNSDASLRYLANEVPKDPRTLLTMYDLDPITRSYVCCPSCFSLYPHSVIKTKKRKPPASFNNSEHHPVAASLDKLELTAPSHCTHRHIYNGEPCGQSLFDNVVGNGNAYDGLVPRLKYEAQDLKQWVGRLLSRSAIEEQVFKAFRRPRKEYMEDMWDAGHLCKILDKEGERFLPGPADETRLAFSFSMDSFNPYHMKEAKQTVSSTAIWLTLLNLPPHLRYRPDNMFLAGIIPGPKKPSLSDTNHSLKLLVEVLLEFFDPGVWFSRTARHSQGCRVRAILVPVVSDMLAARQAGGFASPTATNFCTRCNLRIQDIENLDKSTWPARDVVQQIHHAKRWRDAESLEEQERLFRNYGVRWSPLLDLPYWDPILFTAIEPMHLFDTGLFQTHCRQVWKIDVSAPGGEGPQSAGATTVLRPSNSDMDKWYEVIRATENPVKLRERLNGRDCARDILWHICNDHNLRRAGNKGQLAGSIVEWVSEFVLIGG
jgi:Transposase family tnp2